MKVIIEIDIGENGELCRKHTMEHLMHFVHGLMSQGPMSEHGPFVADDHLDNWKKTFPDEDGGMIFAEGVSPAASHEEAHAMMTGRPPIVTRMLISNQPFNNEHLIPDDDADVVATDSDGEVLSVTPKKELLDNEIRH